MDRSPAQSEHSSASSGGESVIKIRVDRVDQLFQCFDPAPMDQRSVSAEADAYITERAGELPATDRVRLRILVPPGERSCCESVQEAFRRHFSSAAETTAVRLRNHFVMSVRILLISLAVASALVLASQAIADWSETRVARKVASTLSIMVWVALWKPIEMLLHDWRPIKAKLKVYRKLESVKVETLPEE